MKLFFSCRLPFTITSTVFESSLKLELLLQMQSVPLRRYSKLSVLQTASPLRGKMSEPMAPASGAGGGDDGTLLSDVPTSKAEYLFLS